MTSLKCHAILGSDIRTGCAVYIGFPSCNLFFKAGWSKWGNLESLLHSPQQQCFVATICSIKYPTTHRFSSCRIIVLSAMFVRPLLGVQKWRNLFLVRPRVAIDVWNFIPWMVLALIYCFKVRTIRNASVWICTIHRQLNTVPWYGINNSAEQH